MLEGIYHKDVYIPLTRVYALMQKDVKPESKDSDELEVLSILIKEYELKHYPESRIGTCYYWGNKVLSTP
jgi:antitoxin component HigA of HigAB toxin-antitoxin module